MTKPEKSSNSRTGEAQTQPRFRLSLEGLDYDDFTRSHPAGILRFVSYEKGNDLEEQTRKRLAAQKLILGTEMPTYPEDELVNYRIPASSRPIGYDASSSSNTNHGAVSGNKFKYTEEQLFKNAAELLGELAMVRRGSQVGYVHRLGQLLIVTEFDDPGARTLFLAPGIERVLRPTENNIETIAVNYRERMEQEFGDHFTPFSNDFEETFVDIAKR